MLAIRLQRRGRKGHAQFRIIVQESRLSPTSGRVVSYLGAYNPHTKATTLDGDKAATFLSNGAQPSPRVVKILKEQKIKLPKWVDAGPTKKKTTRNPEKLRKNQPKEEAAPAEEAPAVEAATEEPATEATEAPAETPTEEAAEAAPTEDKADEPATGTEAGDKVADDKAE